MNTGLVLSEGGRIRQSHRKSAFTEQGVPEGIILVYVQCTRDTDYSLVTLVCICPVKEFFVFQLMDAFPFLPFIPMIGIDLFAFVARVIRVVIMERISVDKALVFTSLALHLPGCIPGGLKNAFK